MIKFVRAITGRNIFLTFLKLGCNIFSVNISDKHDDGYCNSLNMRIIDQKVTYFAFLKSFLPEASFGLRVLSLPASVCVCVCPSVHPYVNHLLVRTITRDPFKLGSPNLDQRCKYHDFQSQIWLKKSNFLVSSLLEIHNHHITTREPWVPRLLHMPDCIMVSIICA